MHAPAFPVSNRAGFALPADGKVHVVPLGEYPVEHGGRTLVQVVDDQACAAILRNLQTEAQDSSFPGLCVDYDHFRHDPEKSSRAAGWVLNAERRANGIYTAPRWSTSGQAALEQGEYRYISPEFDPGALEPLGGNRYRVTRLVGFGLTNNPNMRGMAPLTNRLAGPEGTAERAGSQEEPQHLVTRKADGTACYVLTTRADGTVGKVTTADASASALTNRAAGEVGPRPAEAARAEMVSTLAGSLRAWDKSLTLAQSYQRAKSAVDAEANAAGSLVLANRARALRAKDRSLSLAASYRLAQAS